MIRSALARELAVFSSIPMARATGVIPLGWTLNKKLWSAAPQHLANIPIFHWVFFFKCSPWMPSCHPLSLHCFVPYQLTVLHFWEYLPGAVKYDSSLCIHCTNIHCEQLEQDKWFLKHPVFSAFPITGNPRGSSNDPSTCQITIWFPSPPPPCINDLIGLLHLPHLSKNAHTCDKSLVFLSQQNVITKCWFLE